MLRIVTAFAVGIPVSVCVVPYVYAHDGAATHQHLQADTRMTPRDANTHETGQLPPARGTGSSATPEVRIVVRDGYRIVTANGIPDHVTGRFPNRGNPNVVSEQAYTFRIPFDPAPPQQPILTANDIFRDNGYLFGVALNGVPFEPATGMNWTPEGIRRGGRPGDWVYEAINGAVDFGMDQANAHVQRTGAYHYHGIPVPMVRNGQPTLVGYAADGYPIYGPMGYQDASDASSPVVTLRSSWQLKTENRPNPPAGPGGKPDGSFTADFIFVSGSGDLDYLNGRFAVTPDYPEGVYHYVLTQDFPHVPRGFAAQPDASFRRMPGEGPNHVSERGDRLSVGDRTGGDRMGGERRPPERGNPRQGAGAWQGLRPPQ